ncbi:MAG TPA: hypothetical protein VFY95_02055 [Sphingomicrobium sp.]
MPLTRDEDLAELLTNARTIAVVGRCPAIEIRRLGIKRREKTES